jgi:hypothetical protein
MKCAWAARTRDGARIRPLPLHRAVTHDTGTVFASPRVLTRTCRPSAPTSLPAPTSQALARSAAAAAGVRGVRTVNFGGEKETVWERTDFPKDKIKAILGKDTLAMLGYGPQGRGQALNARENGVNVIIGLRQGGTSYDQAIQDGCVRRRRGGGGEGALAALVCRTQRRR